MKPDYLGDEESERPGEGFSKLNKENPFTVPENYFDSLADNIQQKINALPDMEKTSGENPFRVPGGYFDSLPSSIQQRIAEGKKKNVFEEWISILLQPKYSLSFAILIVLMIFGIKYFTGTGDVESPRFLSYNEVRNSDYIADLDEATLVDLLEQETNTSTINEDDSYEQYLLDNDVDVSQLENRL